jgi:hypothetical protein
LEKIACGNFLRPSTFSSGKRRGLIYLRKGHLLGRLAAPERRSEMDTRSIIVKRPAKRDAGHVCALNRGAALP